MGLEWEYAMHDYHDRVLQPYIMGYGDSGLNGCYGVRNELELLPPRHAEKCPDLPIRAVPCYMPYHA